MQSNGTVSANTVHAWNGKHGTLFKKCWDPENSLAQSLVLQQENKCLDCPPGCFVKLF